MDENEGGSRVGRKRRKRERKTAARRESNTKKQGNWRQRKTSGCLISDLGRKREEIFFFFFLMGTDEQKASRENWAEERFNVIIGDAHLSGSGVIMSNQ